MVQLQRPDERSSPLERARRHERLTGYAIAIVVVFVVLLIGRAAIVAGSEPAVDQQRLMSAIMTIAQFVVGLATLVLIRNQVSVAVQQIEQSQATSSGRTDPQAQRRAAASGGERIDAKDIREAREE